MGRPRSSNYERNLRYRKDQAGKQALVDVEKTNRKLEQVLRITKGIFGSIGLNQREKADPVLDFTQIQQLSSDGVLLRPNWRVPFQDLRSASYSTSLIGAIHKIDVDMIAPYSKGFYKKSDKEGFGFELDNEDSTPTDHDLQIVKSAVNFFSDMGFKTPGWSKRDRMKSVMEMMIRDTLAIDTVAFQLIRNKFNRVIEMVYLDPATIFETGETGYRNDHTVAFVQVVENQVVTTFEKKDIILRRKHFSSDIYRRNTGFSPTEACIMDLMGVLNALKFNKDRFTSHNPPLGFFSINADVTEDVLTEIQMQFENLYNGNYNNYRFPIIGTSAGEVKYNSLNLPSDMLFSELIQWLVSLVLSAHAVSQEELGFRLRAGQTLSEPNPDKTIKRSSQRRLKSHLAFFTDVFNEIKLHTKQWNKFNFCFYGVEKEDEDIVLQRDKQRTSTYMTVDELRAEKDLPTLGQTMKKIYGMDDETFEKYKFAGNYVDSPSFMQANASTMQGVSGQEQDPLAGLMGMGG